VEGNEWDWGTRCEIHKEPVKRYKNQKKKKNVVLPVIHLNSLYEQKVLPVHFAKHFYALEPWVPSVLYNPNFYKKQRNL